MIYQHGLGYSKYGFNDVLPYEDYIGVMQTASDIFMNNEMSNATLETVYDRLVNSRGLFPDYVTAPGLYRSGSPRQADEIITTDVNDERVQEMLSRVMGSEEAPTPSASVSILPTDKIIWGHPTIGKTTAKQQNDFFDFDTDFKPLVAQKLGLPKSEQNSIGLNKWRKTGNEEEFNQAMREVWTLAKAQAKQQNKMLMVSDMLFLRENASDFDKVINIPTETFIERATERGDNKESLQNWKTKIDKVLESIDQNKIITTDKYLSELLPTEAPEMKRDTPIQPEVSDMIQPEGLPAIPRTSSSCK
jgi:hypothetical protein